jgi:hypothetical protein
MGMIFGTWNIRSLCRAGSLTVVASELAKYMLDTVVVQVVRCDKGGICQQAISHFSMEMGMLIIT